MPGRALTRALLAVRDPINGGFGKLKQPLCPALRFLSRAALRDRQAHTALDQTLDAMLASGEAKSGDTCLIIGFGAGLVYAGQVITIP